MEVSTRKKPAVEQAAAGQAAAGRAQSATGRSVATKRPATGRSVIKRPATGRPTTKKSAAERKKSRRGIVLRVIACIAIISLCIALAWVVGDSDYLATPFGYVPLIVVVAAIITARVYLAVLRRGLRFLERTDVGDCRRGEDVGFTVRFRNTTPLFFFRIEAYFFVSDLFGNKASESMTTVALAPFEKYDLQFTTRFDHIGEYEAGLSHVVISDFLRLFSTTIENNTKRKIQVTPHIQPIEKITFSNQATLETTKAAKSAFSDASDYAFVREYAPGDPIKHIHWKLSARTEKYMTRIYESYTDPGVAVLMDFYGPAAKATDLMGMFDCVVESTFSVARHVRAQGMDVEIHYVNRYGEKMRKVSWSTSEMAQVIAELPRFSNETTRKLEGLELLRGQVLNQNGQNNLVICTADLSADMISAVIEAKARRRNPLVFAVVPSSLVGRERQDWSSGLGRLDAVGIGYVVLAHSDELIGVKA